MNIKTEIVILLATYNGEKYLKEQLDSILHQTYSNFLLVIRDDNSTDSTLKIIESYNDSRLIVLKNNTNKHGQVSNFANLYEYALRNIDFNYLMFSDQDDIWYENKISLCLKFFAEHKALSKALVYTNYTVWNMKTRTQVPAYTEQLDSSFNRLFVQSWLMGCTMMMNRGLVNEIGAIPEDVENHDYWVALVSAINNSIFYLNTETMKHRLHDSNVTTRQDTTSILGRFKTISDNLLNSKSRNKKFMFWKKTYYHLKQQYPDNRNVKELGNILNSHSISRCFRAKQYGYSGLSKKSTILFYLLLLNFR